jgi:hypothetical protein
VGGVNGWSQARGGHGLPKVSPGLAMPYPSTPCRQATPETALRPFQGWPSCRVGDLRPSFTLLDTSYQPPMAMVNGCHLLGRFSTHLVGCSKEKKL